MGDDQSLYHPEAFQFYWHAAETIEQADAATEQQRHKVDMQLVQ